jgi:hypothetical protein
MSKPEENLLVGPCCRRDKSLWIGIASLIAVVSIFCLFYFKVLNFEFPIISGAWLYFYGGHIVAYLVMGVVAFSGLVFIKDYCNSIKTNKNITDLIMGLVIIGICAMFTIWITSQIHHDYLDAELYDKNLVSQMVIIHSMDCPTYLQFYDDNKKAFIHTDRINGQSVANSNINFGLLGLCGKP